MLTDADIEAIRGIIREELQRHVIKRKPPEDITEKRRAAAQAMLKKRKERALAEQSAQPKKRLNGAHSRAIAEQISASAEQMSVGEVWGVYRGAYLAKYGAEPVRNAKVSGQLGQLIKRVGRDAADMAAWYLDHRAQRYLLAGHTIGLLLMDAEKLHTEWATGRRMTVTAAMQGDRTQATGDVFGKLISEVRDHGKIA